MTTICLHAAGHAVARQLEWRLALPSAPTSSQSWMTYDSARGVEVLQARGETWESDSGAVTGWVQRAVGGPAPDPSPSNAIACDSARGVTVYFGGASNNQTWEWDGTPGGAGWTQRMVSGPIARIYHSMAYDSARGVTVLFGGTSNTPPSFSNSETWEWNGTAWTFRTSAGPSPHQGQAMAYDAARGVTVMFGGWNNTNTNDELWEWDGNSWTQRIVSGSPTPPSRWFHSMAYDSARGVVVLFGGVTGSSVTGVINGDTWEWDGSGAGTWTQRMVGAPPEASPPPQDRHSMAYDATRGVTVLFGGVTSDSTIAQTWEWNGSAETWTLRHNQPRPAGVPMVYDSGRGVAMFPAGRGQDGVWEWNGVAREGWVQRGIGSPSPTSALSAMAYDAARGVTTLFGGDTSAGGRNNETWEWDGSGAAGAGVWTQRIVSGPVPSPRRSHKMAYDSARGVTVLFGGSISGSTNSNETWEWNGAEPGTWTQWLVSGPRARINHAMAYDEGRGVTVLFGGSLSSGTMVNDETWEWDGNSWTQHVVSGPSPRGSPALSYDSARGVTVLFGGYPDDNGETWEWNGVSWSQRMISGPSARSSCSMVYDSAHDQNILFGGTFQGDTWVLDVPCRADFNNDSVANSQDFFDFLGAFFADAPAADVNHDTIINSQDFFDFLSAFLAGC